MFFAPLLLTVTTLITIRGIILELSPMIRRPSMALAVRPAANSLIGVIAGTGERFFAVRATREAHIHPSHDPARVRASLATDSALFSSKELC
jgi:hypothetical protein